MIPEPMYVRATEEFRERNVSLHPDGARDCRQAWEMIRMNGEVSERMGATDSGGAGRSVACSTIPLIAHVIYQLDVGGLENGLVNLINRMPEMRYRHAVICMTDYSDFRRRIQRNDVRVFALNKRAGKDVAAYGRLWRLLRRLRPDIIHSRNLPALEASIVAAFAGVAFRVHGEHGHDIHDIDGRSRKYRLLRRFCRPFIHRHIALSRDLERWLREDVGVPAQDIMQIYNGVDTDRFKPSEAKPTGVMPDGFAPPDSFLIGTVGRMQQIKDQLTLVKAFIRLAHANEERNGNLRLALVGDGPLLTQARQLLEEAGLIERAWLPGARIDVANILRCLDVFVLPSLSEGISNVILEAMACGLPVVATRVGGNPELVQEGTTGYLVPSADPEALAAAVRRYIENPQLLHQHGQAGRMRVESVFGMDRMVEKYMAVYDDLLYAWQEVGAR